MSENKIEFFGYPADNLKLSSTSGFYPINKIGLWHSGIHVILKETKAVHNEKKVSKYPVYCPVEGKIIAYNISYVENSSKENYFLIEDEISIPIDNGLKSLKFYSLISGFNNYHNYYSYSNQWNTLSELQDDSDFSEKKLPFGLECEIDIPDYSIKCFKHFGKEYFKGDTIFLNTSNTEVGMISQNGDKDIYKTENIIGFRPIMKSLSKEYILFNTISCNDDFSLLPGTIIKSYHQMDRNQVKLIVSNKNNTINYDKYKNQTGYIISDKDKFLINEFGNIALIDVNRYYWKLNKTRINDIKFDGIILIKNNINTIEKLITSLNESITKDNLYLATKDDRDKQEEKKILRNNLILVKEKLNKYERILITKQADNIIINNDKQAILSNDNKNKFLFRNTEDLLLLNEQYINLCNALKKEIKNIYIIKAPNLTTYQKTFLNNNISGLKIMSQGIDVDDASFKSSLGLFECHPYLFTSDKYTYEFIITMNLLSSLYSEVKITSFDDSNLITKADTTEGCLVFSNTNDNNSKGSTENKYTDKPVGIAKSTELLLNLEDVLKNSNLKDPGKLIWCQIESGYICCKAEDINLRITLSNYEFEYNEKKVLFEKFIFKNSFLGYSDNQMIDWSVFFTENLLDINPECNELTLKTDDKCYLCTNDEEKVYIPNNCLIIKEKYTLNPEFVKINKFKLRISVYRNDNKYINENNETAYGIEITDNSPKTNDNKIIKCNKFLKKIYIYTSYIDIKYDERNNKFSVDKIYNISANNIKVEDRVYKEFYNDIILPKLLDKSYDAYFTNDSSGGFFNFYIDFSPSDYNIPIEYKEFFLIKEKDSTSITMIDEDKGKIFDKKLNENKKGQVIIIHNPIEKVTPTTIGKENENKNFIIKEIKSIQLNSPFLYFYINSKKYKIETPKINSRIKNPFKEYLESILTLNFKDKKSSMISKTSTCPTDKLLCDLSQLKTELSDYENGKFKKYIDISNENSNSTGNTNYLYNKDCYSKILKELLYNSMAYHPFERNKTLYTKAQEKIKELKVWNDNVNIDINQELKNFNSISSNTQKFLLSNNSFYFVYPPQFYKKLEECGLREINPYSNFSFSVSNYMNSENGQNDGTKIFNAVTNPGFAPFLGEGQGINGFANVCTQWFNEWPYVNTNDYHHEGVDFSVGGKDYCNKIPIKALIPGTVIYSSGDQGNKAYGKYLIIKADKQYNDKYMYFLLGHISRDMYYVKEGHVSPGQIIAYVGNTGHCIGGGYNMEGEKNVNARNDGYGAHLHLTLLLRPEEDPENFLKNINAVKGYPENDLWITRQKFGNVNPFNYDEKYYKRKDE